MQKSHFRISHSDVALVDKTVPLFTQYEYPIQLKMKHTFTRTMCKGIVKRMKVDCDSSGYDVPGWADVSKANHGIVTDQILTCPKYSRDIGYRNKCEFSAGIADCLTTTEDYPKDCLGTPFNVGFVQRMESSNEQVVGSPQDLPHIPKSCKRVAEIFRNVIKESGLPVYRRDRDKRTGFWRLIMCRVVDTVEKNDPLSTSTLSSAAKMSENPSMSNTWRFDQRFDLTRAEGECQFQDQELESQYVPPEKQPILLVVQTTICQDLGFIRAIRNLLVKHFIQGNTTCNVQAIYLQMNDGMSDAFDTLSHVINFASDVNKGKEIGTDAEESVSNVLGRMPKSGEKEIVETAEFIQGKRKNKHFSLGELLTDTAAESTAERSSPEKEDCSEVEEVEDKELRTATGNLMRQRTKNERKKKLNRNVNPDQMLYHIFGPQQLEMPLCGLKFQVGPSSFFQTNSIVTQKLYTKALQWAGVLDKDAPLMIGCFDLRNMSSRTGQEERNVEEAIKDDTTALTAQERSPSSEKHAIPAAKKRLILDVCSGVGTIGCIAARHADENTHVIGVELIPEAVVSANKNAELNKLERCWTLNTQFFI